MDEKKDLKGSLADGLAEVIKNSGDLSIERQPDGLIRTGFTLYISPARSFRLKIERRSTGKLSFECDPLKVVPGQVKGKSQRKQVR